MPPCPHLPRPDTVLDYRLLSAHEDRRDARFYGDALRYGQHLWLHGHAGRAILAVTRALYADVPPHEPVLQEWPLPYAALRWIVAHHPRDEFPGNPRVSFQHQATRLRGPRQEQRRARAWAVWALIREVRPQLPGDPSQNLIEPDLETIAEGLTRHGHRGEERLWRTVLQG
ncbi:MAG: hypothetical protein ACLFR7_00490 [Opitutales bacterium]